MSKFQRRSIYSGTIGTFVIGDAPVGAVGVGWNGGSHTQRIARKRLNQQPTKAEKQLAIILNSLDNRVLKGKFQRKWAFAGKWILDFFFYENRLGIEVDGSYHNSAKQIQKNLDKEKACDKFDITLLRLTNQEVFGCRQTLIQKLRKSYKIANEKIKNGKTKISNVPEEEFKMHLDELRQKYLNKPRYTYDGTITEDLFTEDEISNIEKYGNWFNAIWNDEVELVTDKLKHFYTAKSNKFKGQRTPMEELWYRYKQNESPFVVQNTITSEILKKEDRLSIMNNLKKEDRLSITNNLKKCPTELAQRLTKYVDDLIEAKKTNKKLAIKGRTQMILTVLDKLRDIDKHNPISTDLVNQIVADENRAELKLPKTSSNYSSFCWYCLKRGKQVVVDKRVDSVCPSCSWVQCPDCGACRSPRFGGCKNRVFFTPKKSKKRHFK